MMSTAATLPLLETPAIPELADLLSRVADLEHELMLAKVRNGELGPPDSIATLQDARIWLTWAHANHHQDGCLCHRCPIARRMARPTCIADDKKRNINE